MSSSPATAMTSGGRIGTVLRDAMSRLRGSGSPTPRLDAEVLMAHALGRDRSWILAHPELALSAQASAAFEAAMDRRALGEPIAYIRGFKEWHSMRLRTDRRVLIPRPETELLADAAGDEIAARIAAGAGPVVAWEVGTGSGAVAIVLAMRFRDAIESGTVRLIATDVSTDALELAADNLGVHGVADLVTLVAADLLAPAGSELPRPDVVVANLPYVASAEVDARRGSLGFEPRVAVDGGPDGLSILRRLVAELSQRATRGATVLLEVGVSQAEAVAGLVGPAASVSILPDLTGLDRVVRLGLDRQPA